MVYNEGNTLFEIKLQGMNLMVVSSSWSNGQGLSHQGGVSQETLSVEVWVSHIPWSYDLNILHSLF